MNFEITAIRYQMPGKNFEEKTQNAQKFVAQLPIPSMVYLKREPDNVYSSNAIAVYYQNYNKIGYISENYTKEIQRVFPQEQSSTTIVKAKVIGKVGYITLTADVDIPKECLLPPEPYKRKIDPSPFDISMPFMEEENKIELVTSLLLPRDFKDEDAEELIRLSEHYCAQIPLTLCDVDCKNTSRILNKLKDFTNNHSAISSSTKKKLENLCHKIQNLVANIHREEDRNKIYENHLARMKEFFSNEKDGFFKRYDDNYLKVPLGLAKTEVIESEINRLTAWLDKVPRGIFHSHNLKKKDIVPQMRYLHLSRREMYDIMGTELVVLRLKEQLYQNELIKNLESYSEQQNAVPDEVCIPDDCRDAINKVMKPTFTLPNKAVMISRNQIVKAAYVIDLTANVQVAMLMAISIDVEAIRSGTKSIDFIRALIGIGVLKYSDDKAIKNMSDGMNKKLKTLKRNKEHVSSNHPDYLLWKDKDKEIGKEIYKAMTTE
ncbi:HIRAN domain-containing protein [Segatella copri]|uniref:HIRAN domain-containing protein n=1 Tax=Segatella copri TaxID=165179 RepID=UPI002FEEDA35